MYLSLIAIVFLAATLPAIGQSPQETLPATPAATVSPLQTLSTQEQTEYKQAVQAANSSKYAEATSIYEELLRAHTGDAFLTKCLAESEINAGDPARAQGQLKPIVAASPSDGQAAILPARTYAQQLPGSPPRCRAGAHCKASSERYCPPANAAILVGADSIEGNRTLLIFHSLVPWGYYHVYEYARLLDSEGKLLQRFTLESDDSDQPAFAKNHPVEAAAGRRILSYDGYIAGPANPNGTAIETHITYSFAESEPSYTDVKAQFLKEAAGIAAPISSRVTSVAPANRSTRCCPNGRSAQLLLPGRAMPVLHAVPAVDSAVLHPWPDGSIFHHPGAGQR